MARAGQSGAPTTGSGSTPPSRLYIGTSGWSYPKGQGAWDGTFYPPKLADKDKLTFYSQYFNTVEINSSFYRPPSAHAAKAWATKVPEDFRFTVKLWQKFTHPKMFEAATGQSWQVQDEDFGVFAEGIAPLAEAGKLGPLLAQFPTSFRPDAPTVEYLEDLIRRMRGAGFPLAVELRHREWTEGDETAAIRALMEQEHVAWVMIDEPRFKTSIRHVPLTSETAYFRFHGRNYAQWWKHGESEDRYNYLYTPDEQHHLAEDVREVAVKTAETYAFYNNHYGAKAVVNALQLEMALGRPLTAPLPQPLVQTYPDLTAELTGRA
ncbi:MAG TPA: DUF72 domain-containing protein [Chloroflexota bacterium]|jgi:uncharacterized protein YecE (DUF72 family)|nr:DUF72 domain-containing protein [Chloroflexota bacterium]